MSERRIAFVEAIREAMAEEMERDSRIVILGEDIGVYGGVFTATKTLLERFGAERVRDTPISEAAMAGIAIGMAMQGMRPIVEFMYADFTTIAMDQIVNNAAKLRYMTGGKASVPLVVRTQGGSGRGNGSQHSQSLETWFAHVPGLIVVTPSTPADAKGLLISAIRNENPVIFIEHKMLYFTTGVVRDGTDYQLGKAEIKRLGDDVTVVATSWMIPRVMRIAEELASEGISAEIVDPLTLRPLDENTIVSSVCKTGRLVVVHEAVRYCGFGAEIAAAVQEKAFKKLKAPVKRIAGKEAPIPYSANLERSAIPDEVEIKNAIRDIVQM